MYRSLYFKIILIFVVFMVTVMAVVGTVLLNNVFQFYTKEFVTQIDRYLYQGGGQGQLREELYNALDTDNYVELLKEILSAYSTSLGIDDYRNYYILDENGNYLEGSNPELKKDLFITPNLLTAMKNEDGKTQLLGADYTDYAIFLKNGDNKCIIYIKDTQDEMRQLSWQLFSIILQTVLFGLLIAVVLSFFLAKAITSPIQSLTTGVQLITAGEFTEEIDVHGKDEIGTLTETFNKMKQVLKNTLEEVYGEREKLETILLYLKDSVIAFTDKGIIIHINKSALNLFGGVNLQNMSLIDFLGLLNVDYVRNDLSEINNEQSYILRDVEYGDKALDITISMLKYIENNKIHEGFIVVIHDITSRYELDKAQREFVANVSHELRTPLCVIKGSIESILLYPDMTKDFKDSFINNAIEECDRMLRLISDLLILSQLNNNKTKWKVSRFNLNEFLQHICEMMRTDAEKKNQTIIYNSKNLPYISADQDRIKQVIINIISNSIKYTPENGVINISVKQNDDKVQMIIKDNGVGIPKEDLPRIFDRFYRVEKARTSDTGGTGLGLAIAKEIVEAHGGKIIIISSLGNGTEVTIELPLTTKLESE